MVASLRSKRAYASVQQAATNAPAAPDENDPATRQGPEKERLAGRHQNAPGQTRRRQGGGVALPDAPRGAALAQERDGRASQGGAERQRQRRGRHGGLLRPAGREEARAVPLHGAQDEPCPQKARAERADGKLPGRMLLLSERGLSLFGRHAACRPSMPPVLPHAAPALPRPCARRPGFLARRGAAPGEGAARRWDDYSAPARPVPGHCLARSATTRHDAKIQPEVVGVFTRLLPREAQTGALRAAYARTQEAARIRAWPPGRGRKGEAWARQRTRPSTRRPAGAGSAPEATRPRWT